MPTQIISESHAKIILVSLKIVCRKCANMDLRGEEKENFRKSKSNNSIGEKDIYLLSKWKSSH